MNKVIQRLKKRGWFDKNGFLCSSDNPSSPQINVTGQVLTISGRYAEHNKDWRDLLSILKTEMFPLSDEEKYTWRNHLYQAMSDVSESIWAAGWIVDNEHSIWINRENYPGIMHIAEVLNEWPCYSQSRYDSKPQWFSLDDWVAYHQEWQKAQAIKNKEFMKIKRLWEENDV